jgi:hypothetical protein
VFDNGRKEVASAPVCDYRVMPMQGHRSCPTNVELKNTALLRDS